MRKSELFQSFSFACGVDPRMLISPIFNTSHALLRVLMCFGNVVCGCALFHALVCFLFVCFALRKFRILFAIGFKMRLLRWANVCGCHGPSLDF